MKMLKYLHNNFVYILKSIQDGEGKKAPPTSFSLVTSTNVGLGPQNFLTFSFNPFATLEQNFKFFTYCQSQIIELEPRPPLKESYFSGQILIKVRLW